MFASQHLNYVSREVYFFVLFATGIIYFKIIDSQRSETGKKSLQNI